MSLQSLVRRDAPVEAFEFLRLILDNALDAFVSIDGDGNVVDWNRRAEEIFGWSRDEAMGRPLTETIIPPAQRDAHRAGLARLAQTGEQRLLNRRIEVEALRRDGTTLDIELSIVELGRPGQKMYGASLRDISSAKRVAEALRLSESRLRTALDGIPHLCGIFDPELIIEFGNSPLARFCRLDEQSLAGKSVEDALPKDAAGAYVTLLRRALESALPQTGETEFVSDGIACTFSLSFTPLLDDKGDVRHIVGIAHDVSERKRYEMQLADLAQQDPLTGLPNRTLLMDRFSQALARARRSATQVAAMLIDLDRFKAINDTLGHAAGDLVLIEVAHRFSRNLREVDTLARIGGDEFVVLIEGCSGHDELSELASRLLASLSAPLQRDGREIYLSASIGIAVYPDQGEETETLLKFADIAMYSVKRNSGGGFDFFREKLVKKSIEQIHLQHELRRAFDRHELLLHYQPQLEIATGRLVGMEALVRWNHPTLGLLAPARFIDVAEETGLIVPLGDYVLDAALKQYRDWQDAGSAPFKMSVNFSSRQFRQADVVDRVRTALTRHRVAAGQLEIEITEYVLLEHSEELLAKMRALSEMGVRFALDDFGTGYSSFMYLSRFPLDTVKIDQSFVSTITANASDLAIVTAVISLARELGLNTIAEGVENREQLRLLESLHCNQYQGYLYSPPVAASDVAPYLDAQTTLRHTVSLASSRTEESRLAALASYDILDTPAERPYDDVVRMVGEICEVPIAMISLVDRNRLWFKARLGLPVQQVSREVRFCCVAIGSTDLFVVPDARNDARFRRDPFVIADPQVRFYAGYPLVDGDGCALGTLCVYDRVPRRLTPTQEQALRVMGQHVLTLFEQRRRQREPQLQVTPSS